MVCEDEGGVLAKYQCSYEMGGSSIYEYIQQKNENKSPKMRDNNNKIGYQLPFTLQLITSAFLDDFAVCQCQSGYCSTMARSCWKAMCPFLRLLR